MDSCVFRGTGKKEKSCGGFAVSKSETFLKKSVLPDKILFASDYYI
jgi:hypothetical protein